MLNMIDVGKEYGSMDMESISHNNLTVLDRLYLRENYGYESQNPRNFELTESIKKELFNKNRMELGMAFGFDERKMFIASQEKRDGSYFEITEDFVRSNREGWAHIPEDILIITDKVPGVVIGHPVADCRVVMVTDMRKNVTAIAHCSPLLINKNMPAMVVDALQEAYDSKDDELIAYIGSGAGPDFSYDAYPIWATDKRLWNNAIYQDKSGSFRIDMRKVMYNELAERGVKFIYGSTIDTLKDEEYFSDSMASPNGGNDPSKQGKNFQGAFYSVPIKYNPNLRLIK